MSLFYPIDITDYHGNTTLCYSVVKNDYKVFNLLRQANANPKSQCINNISSEQIKNFNEGYVKWYKSIVKNTTDQALNNVSKTVTTTGLSMGAKIGIGVGTVALIGAGAALADGGGGSSSAPSESDDKGGSNSEITPLNCQNDTWNGSKCMCDKGYVGTLCDTPKEATKWYQSIPCGNGYDTVDTFLSGTTNYYKCTPKDCSGYQADCDVKYNAIEACMSGTTPYYTCEVKTLANGYTTMECSAGYDLVDQTVSEGLTYYKCTPKEVPSGYQTTVYGAEYITTDILLSGTTTYYKCTLKDGYKLM